MPFVFSGGQMCKNVPAVETAKCVSFKERGRPRKIWMKLEIIPGELCRSECNGSAYIKVDLYSG